MDTLLIEDDDTIARELALRWTRRRWAMERCSSLDQARPRLSTPGRFDLLLLDLGLPDGDGLDFLVELRRRDPQMAVVVITARDLVADRVAGLRKGADDYLVKPFAMEELEARAEGVLRRRQVEHSRRLQLGPLVWIESERTATLDGKPLELSPREFEVLGILLRRAPHLTPKGLLTDELAQGSRDADDGLVEVYISRLRRKLQGSGIGIRTLRGFGYVLEADGAA